MQVADHASVEKVAPDADAAVKEEETAVKTKRGPWPPLMTAAYKGDVEATQELLHARADVNVTFARKGQGKTPIFYAIRFGHDNIVRLLLQQPDIDITSKILEAAKASGPESLVYDVLAKRGLLPSPAQPSQQPKAVPSPQPAAKSCAQCSTAEPLMRHESAPERLAPRQDHWISPTLLEENLYKRNKAMLGAQRPCVMPAGTTISVFRA